MPKARRKKNTVFNTSPVKSVFLYGNPNKGKLDVLLHMQRMYIELVNTYIDALMLGSDLFVSLAKNDKKDSQVRSFQKNLRKSELNSAFCQIAFDSAFTKVANRLDAIRLEMFQHLNTMFCQSKILFGLSLGHASRSDMIAYLQDVCVKLHSRKDVSFYESCICELETITEESFHMQMAEFHEWYDMISKEFQIPYVKKEAIPCDSRLMRIEESNSTEMPYVISLSNPFKKGERFSVPVGTSQHSLHKIKTNKMAATVTIKAQGRKIRIGWSYTKPLHEQKTIQTVGVDTGIRDAFFLSDGRSIGTMKEVLDFYHKEVEPAFAELSNIRNKKRKISFYIRHHKNLPEDVRRSLIQKMDNLEYMIRTSDASYRKKKAYYSMLNHEISQDVKAYIQSISQNTLTVLELLDIKEFKKSKKLNGDLSTFARGRLQQKLMSELNWYGYSYIEVAPDFTSQTCPVCGHVSSMNRSSTDSKKFRCTCCGHEDDADHVGAINIKARVEDTEIADICQNSKGHKALQSNLKTLLSQRHTEWMHAHS